MNNNLLGYANLFGKAILKYAFEKEMRERGTMPLLRRIFTRKPDDPCPGTKSGSGNLARTAVLQCAFLPFELSAEQASRVFRNGTYKVEETGKSFSVSVAIRPGDRCPFTPVITAVYDNGRRKFTKSFSFTADGTPVEETRPRDHRPLPGVTFLPAAFRPAATAFASAKENLSWILCANRPIGKI